MTLYTTLCHVVQGRYLYAGRSPRDELCELPLPNPLEGLVHLGRVHLTLDDVEDGDVAMVVMFITWC